MNISSVSAVSAVYTGYSHPGFNAGGGSGTTSVNKTADGATITTQRGSFGDIVSVTTSTPAARNPLPQTTESTVDITA